MTHWIALLLATASLTTAQTVGPQWSHDYGEALAATRSLQRPLLIVLDRPEEESRRILPARFTPDATGKALLKPYELCHVDVATPYGRRVAEAFQVTQFPYTAIIDRSGQKIIFRQAGKFNTDEWASTLIEYKEGRIKQPVQQDENCFT